MLKIRLQRVGRRNNPSYRVVVVESTMAARKGKPVELLGTHDTIRKTTTLNNERITYWMSQGAQVSDTMHNILIKNGVIEGVKINALPKKQPVEKEKEANDVVATDTTNTTTATRPDESENDESTKNNKAPQAASPKKQGIPSAEG